MKKLLLIAALIVALLVPFSGRAAELNNITSAGVDGDLVFYDKSGNAIITLDAANRKFEIPTGSVLDVETGGSLKIAGTAITSSAAEVNKLASIGTGDVLTTTNTKTMTSKILSGGTHVNLTLTTPVIATIYQDAAKTLLVTLPAAADTLMGKATTDTFTNKTYDTAGAGNAFSINSTAISAVTGTGAAVLATSPTIATPIITNPDVSFGVSSNAFAAGEDWTLSTAEKKSVLLIVSSGSGTPSIIADASSSGKVYVLRNAANINVILKASGQTGVTVASGKTAILMNSGTDFVRVTSDAIH